MEFPKSKYSIVDDWFLMSSPVPVSLIWLAYITFVLKIGPAYFKNRPPMKLKNTLLVYNAFQVVYSGYIVAIGLPHILRYGLVHKECLIDNDESTRNMILGGAWYYFMGKTSELLDTIFFVLRKKDNQISFLHVYHHSIMMILSWLFIKYIPTDSVVALGTLNSFVHVIMYAYYGLSSLGPGIAKYLTWKKYITKLQLFQFACILVQLFAQQYKTDCKSTGLPVFIVGIPNLLLFLYLFADFYKQSYKTNSNGVANGKSSISKNGIYTNGKTDLNGNSESNGKAHLYSKTVLNRSTGLNGKANLNGKSGINGFDLNGKAASNGHSSSKATKIH